MNTATDLNLITYVIILNNHRADAPIYYTNRDDPQHSTMTTKLSEATIYPTVGAARAAKKGKAIIPVSKKVFFEARLKGI